MFKKIERYIRSTTDRSTSIHFRVYRTNKQVKGKKHLFVIGKHLLPKLGLVDAEWVEVYVDSKDPYLFMLKPSETPGFKVSPQSATGSAKAVTFVRDNMPFDFGQYQVEITEKKVGKKTETVLRVLPKLEGVK